MALFRGGRGGRRGGGEGRERGSFRRVQPVAAGQGLARPGARDGDRFAPRPDHRPGARAGKRRDRPALLVRYQERRQDVRSGRRRQDRQGGREQGRRRQPRLSVWGGAGRRLGGLFHPNQPNKRRPSARADPASGYTPHSGTGWMKLITAVYRKIAIRTASAE